MNELIEKIHQHIDRYGWSYEYDPESRTWHSGFRGKANNFNIFVHLTENWLIFSIAPLVNAPEESVCEQRLHKHLLQLNFIINMAKFSLDEDGDVVLTVELPTENLDYSEFADGLNALSYYADTHYLEILNVAQDPEYAPSGLEEWVAPPPGGGEGGEVN